MRLTPLLPILAIALVTGAAQAKLGDRWAIVGTDRQSDCTLALRSNPIAIRIDASGFIPAETLQLVIRNGEMKPLRLSVRAGADGRFSDYYAPLKSAYGDRRFGAPVTSASDSGEVMIEISAARCTLRASSPWTKELRTIP